MKKKLGDKAFETRALRLWNSLNEDIQQTESGAENILLSYFIHWFYVGLVFILSWQIFKLLLNLYSYFDVFLLHLLFGKHFVTLFWEVLFK